MDVNDSIKIEPAEKKEENKPEIEGKAISIEEEVTEKESENDIFLTDEEDDERDEYDEEEDDVGELISNNVVVNVNNSSQDTEFSCPSCFTEMDASKYGKITCHNCGNYVFRRNLTLDIQKFVSIEDADLSLRYSDVIARINNNYIRRNFDSSFKYCLEAEKLAPREPLTWEYYTRVEYFVETSKPIKLRLKRKDILKRFRENIRICEANGVSPQKVEELKAEVALNLMNKAKSKIGRLYQDSINNKGNWKKGGLYKTRQNLKIFEDCFHLTRDPYYLKEYIQELSRDYKWMVKNDDGELIKLPSCGKKFNVVQERARLLQKIHKIEEDYIPPDIASARLLIKTIDVVQDQKDINGIGIIYK